LARTAYFDCFSGASGDMILGALLDAGLPDRALRDALGSLAIEYGEVSSARVLRSGISATKFSVGVPDRQAVAPAVHPHAHDHHSHEHHTHAHVHGSGPSPHHDHHSLTDIARYIERSALSREGKDRAVQLFRRLSEAEAAIHDMPVDSVHLHEVGAVDSIIDIVGAVYGMEWLGVDNVVASPLNVGSGTVTCAHGTFPVPAPATALLLRGVPVYAGRVAAELVTPTGALLITEYAKRFGPLPEMRIDVVGYGAGDRDFSDHPNVLRLLVGETASTPGLERIVVLECEIDDMNPQLFGPLMDALYAAGALEVFYAAVQMKKNRPGTLVTVIAPPDRREALAGKLFAETTTIGVRYQELLRERLEREIRILDTPVGPIRFKVATRDGRVLNAAPEFDDCAKAAAERGMSIKDVHAIAQKAWLDDSRQK
jgi:pyridinium-3,5-bisthiocarboxylic acid mononucleotide nickel chelatase